MALRRLHLADRLALRSGADLHLRDLLCWQARRGPVTLVVGRVEPGVRAPDGVRLARCRALASAVPSRRGLAQLSPLLDQADVLHLHNVMNPDVLARVTETGRAVVTLQDHRMFCPGPGRSLPDGAHCARPMSSTGCAECLPDPEYRDRTLALTRARRDAVAGAQLVVLSRYMADECAQAGLPGARVIPPPVQAAEAPSPVGHGFLLGGRLVSHKGVQAGWRAWQAAGCEGGLAAAGEGPLASSLVGVEQLGWLDRTAWRRALRGSRALIQTPHWQEPFGIAGLEALAEGTPVVGWPTGGMVDWARDGCVWVDRGDETALAQALQDLDRDSAQAAGVGREAWRSVRQRPPTQALHERLEAVYASIGRAWAAASSSCTRSSR